MEIENKVYSVVFSFYATLYVQSTKKRFLLAFIANIIKIDGKRV